MFTIFYSTAYRSGAAHDFVPIENVGPFQDDVQDAVRLAVDAVHAWQHPDDDAAVKTVIEIVYSPQKTR